MGIRSICRDIDWEAAYRAVVHDAEARSTDSLKEGRGGLDDWLNLGYLTIEGTDPSASR